MDSSKALDDNATTLNNILNRNTIGKSYPEAPLVARSTTVTHPKKYRGLDFRPRYDEQGSAQIELILKHLQSKSVVGKHIEIALAWAQRQSGIGSNILEAPVESLPHLNVVYFKSIVQFLSAINGKIVLEQDFRPPVQRQHDDYIMDFIIASTEFTPQDVKRINACRLYLDVHTISDMALASRDYIHPAVISGNKEAMTSSSCDLECIQQRPTS